MSLGSESCFKNAQNRVDYSQRHTPDRPFEAEIGDRDCSHVAETCDRDKITRNLRPNMATATQAKSPIPATATERRDNWRPKSATGDRMKSNRRPKSATATFFVHAIGDRDNFKSNRRPNSATTTCYSSPNRRPRRNFVAEIGDRDKTEYFCAGKDGLCPLKNHHILYSDIVND